MVTLDNLVFDIDHLYLASYNYHKIKDGKKEIISTEYEEGSSKYYQNKIIDNMMTLLKDTKNSFSYLFKSIDNDTEPILNIANKIESEDNVSDEAYNFGTLHEQISRRNDYVTGGIGIGPFALNVTNHILTYLYGVKFKDSKFTTETGILRLDHLVDKDGNSISSWLSGFINAHVDIVKDPYISKLNVNQFTYNLLNLLIRSGFGDTSVWFLCQPVIRAMASASNAYNSLYSKDYKKGGIEQAMYDAIVPIIGEIKQSDIDYYMAPKNVYERIMIVNSVLKNTALLEAIAKNPKAKTVKVNGVDYDVKLFQKNVFLAFKFIEPYSDALGNLVQYTKIDTRKQGKTFIEMILYENGYNKLFFTKQDFSIWDKESLDNLRENSWIELKTENAINVPLRILSKQSFYANNSFINAVIKFSRTLVGDDQPLTKDLLKQIGLSLSTAIKQDYINRYAKHNNINIKSLFVGYNTINVLLNIWKSAPDIVPKYRRLRNNLLLQQLFVSTIEQDVYLSNRKAKVPQFITISQNIDNSRVDSEALTDAWEDLLMDEDPKVRRFAKFLIVYAYTSSGDYKGWNKLAKYVPFSWISGLLEDSTIDGESFSDYISDKLTNPLSYFEYLDDIVKNNFLDTRIVKRVNMRDSEGNNNFITVNNNKDYKSPYILFTYNKDIQHSYITIRKQGSFKDPNDSVNLYKLVNTDDVSGRSTYVLINKKGIHTKQGDIYEYGREDNYDQNWNNIPNNLLDKVEDFINIEINTNVQLDDDYSIRVMLMWIDREDLPLISSMPKYRDELFKIGNSDKNLQQDGGNYDLPFHEQDDPENFNNVELSEKVLSSNKTILSNEELRMWNENGVGENPRILVASEHSDPAFHVDHILKVLNGEESIEAFDGKRISGKDFAGLYLITKHDGLPMKRLLETKIPKIIHFSVTGLGGTKYEPGVMKAKDLLNKINDYINMGLDPGVITIRIDPIVPGVTSPKMIEDIIYRSVQMGIKRFKFSIMDMYPNTAASMEKLGYNIERNYGFNKNGKPNFHAKPEIFNKILNFLLQMKDKYEISLHACAERYIKPGIEKEGCLSVRLVNQMLGTNFEDKLEENNKQRLKCTCFGGKTDVLKYGAHCASHCVYCYAKHENDAAMRYYNEDGTLKDNDFTRTKPATIDSREITDNGKQAIKDVSNNTFGNTSSTVKNVWKQAKEKYTRKSVQNDPTTLYIFTDNTDRTSGGEQYESGWYKLKYGEGGFGSYNNPTTAVIRGLDNAAPISTMRYFYRNHEGMSVSQARWTDNDIEEFERVITDEINEIKRLWDTGKFKQIVFPGGGGFFNSKIAKINRDSKIGKILSKKLKELYDYTNSTGDVIDNNQQLSNNSINVYAGNNENTELSNFATRLFVIEGNMFESVEQYFQYKKAEFAGDTDAIKILKKSNISGAQARRIGRNIKGLNVKEWDKISTDILKKGMLESFKQNSKYTKLLLNTGNSTITHMYNGVELDNGKFSKLLMEVRDELKKDNDLTSDNNQFGLSKEELNKANEIKKHCKGE